ncbi:MAG: hypothetical protein Q9164_004673 [Protoblastenia rupestris]
MQWDENGWKCLMTVPENPCEALQSVYSCPSRCTHDAINKLALGDNRVLTLQNLGRRLLCPKHAKQEAIVNAFTESVREQLSNFSPIFRVSIEDLQVFDDDGNSAAGNSGSTVPSDQEAAPSDTRSSHTSFNPKKAGHAPPMLEQGHPRKRSRKSSGCMPDFHSVPLPPRSSSDIADSVLALMENDIGKSNGATWGYIYVLQIPKCPGYVKIGWTTQTIKKRKQQIQSCIPSPLSSELNDTICKVKYPKRVEALIFEDLCNERRGFFCPCNNDRRKHRSDEINEIQSLTEHSEWFELDALRSTHYVNKWRNWMQTEPYGINGVLREKWTRRIHYFRTHESQQKALLEKHEGIGRWSDLMEPGTWMRLRMETYRLLYHERPSRMENLCSSKPEDHFESLLPYGALYIFIFGLMVILAWSGVKLFWPMALLNLFTFSLILL